MLFEYTPKCLTGNLWEGWNPPQDRNSAIAVQGLAVIRVFFAVKNDACERYPSLAKCFEAEESVIYSPQRGSRHKDHREAQVLHEVHHEIGIIEWNQHAPCALHDQPFRVGDPGVRIASSRMWTPFHSAAKWGETGSGKQ